MDAADAAGDEQELVADLLLRQHKAAAAQHQEVIGGFTGLCLNCEAKLEVGRFCDADCREDYTKRVSAQRR